MDFDANAIFEDELARRGLNFVREDELTYQIALGDLDVTANLENVRRNAERDADPDAIRRFVDKILDAFPKKRPNWLEASAYLLWSAERTDSDFGDTVHEVVTDDVARVLTLTDADQSRIAWVTPDMCERWGVSIEDACAQAFANQNRLLDGITLELAPVHDESLGIVPVNSPYKGSVIFARAFKGLVAPHLGWPVLVVLPRRDFIYVVADNSPLLGNIGYVVVEEYKNSGYPLTTEVLRISDDGIEAIGNFPT